MQLSFREKLAELIPAESRVRHSFVVVVINVVVSDYAWEFRFI